MRRSRSSGPCRTCQTLGAWCHSIDHSHLFKTGFKSIMPSRSACALLLVGLLACCTGSHALRCSQKDYQCRDHRLVWRNRGPHAMQGHRVSVWTATAGAALRRGSIARPNSAGGKIGGWKWTMVVQTTIDLSDLPGFLPWRAISRASPNQSQPIVSVGCHTASSPLPLAGPPPPLQRLPPVVDRGGSDLVCKKSETLPSPHPSDPCSEFCLGGMVFQCPTGTVCTTSNNGLSPCTWATSAASCPGGWGRE